MSGPWHEFRTGRNWRRNWKKTEAMLEETVPGLVIVAVVLVLLFCGMIILTEPDPFWPPTPMLKAAFVLLGMLSFPIVLFVSAYIFEFFKDRRS